jgi:hypothetical protein
MQIHKKKHSERTTYYYFTKDKNQCLMIEYDERMDFGDQSTSGISISNLEMHYQNSWRKENLTEIKISEVPKSIIDILTYLK